MACPPWSFSRRCPRRLLAITVASLDRYASSERATPVRVVERLQWLAMVVSALAGTYDQHGIQRWFERERSQLGGRCRREVLGREWRPDDPAAQRVHALALTLVGG